MTAFEYRKYELCCNSPHLHEPPALAWFVPPAQKTRCIARAKVRILAAKAGWTHVPSPSGRKYDQDFCPAHNPEPTP